MKKAVFTIVALAAITVAIASPVKRILSGTATAGAQQNHTFGTGEFYPGAVGSVLFRTSSANPTGTVCLLLTRAGQYTNAIVYCKALTNEQNHVVWFANSLGLLQADLLSVTNGTGDSLKYSITLTQ